MMESVSVRMTDPSKVAELRRLTLERVKAFAWSEEEAGRAALLATEVATNLLKHAKDGSVVVVADRARGDARLQLVAVDHGPGIRDVESCMKDGYSTAGSPGTGLGALQRMASALEIFSTPGKGTVLVAELAAAHRSDVPSPQRFSVGGICLACPGETESGDSWDYAIGEESLHLMVCDGLGHGVLAAEAARRAVIAFRESPLAPVTQSLSRIHDALRPTRGAAAAIAMVDRKAGQLRFCGVGNISGSIVTGNQVRHLVSHNGTLGHLAPRIAEFAYPWNDSCQLVMHSDGISARWRADEWPGLWRRAPALVAGALCRDWARGRDDATAVIARPV